MIFDTLAVLVSISQKSIQGEKKVPKSSNQPRSQICTLFFVMSSSSYSKVTLTSFRYKTDKIGMHFKVARTEEVTQLWGSEKDGAILSLQTIWTCSEPSETVIPTFREMCGASSHDVQISAQKKYRSWRLLSSKSLLFKSHNRGPRTWERARRHLFEWRLLFDIQKTFLSSS